MNIVICSVYDRVSESFGPLMTFPNQGTAIRSFSEAVNDKAKSDNLAKYPADYDLIQVGLFDTASGVIEAMLPNELIGNGSKFVVSE